MSLKEGTYTILHQSAPQLPGEVQGSFKIKGGQLVDLEGIARHILRPGPLTPALEFQINRIQNGYLTVEYQQPVYGN
jgi:hypothetical protein